MTVTRSEGEALLLENNFIKAHEPRYNILYRDDKSYPYICISGDPYPQLRFHRGALDKRHRFFGPFPGAGAVREGIATLQKVFQLRTCENTVFANRSRPCMLHQIQRCTAPCVGRIGEAEYREDVEGASLFLRGKASEVLTRLQAQMEEAAGKLEFERAARIRDKIARMQMLQSRQFVESATAGDIDVVGAAIERGLFAVNVVMIRGGRHVGDKTFFPRYADAAAVEGEGEIVPAFLTQHYLERPVPPTIIVPDVEDHAALAEVLTAQSGQKVDIVGNPGGERRVWLTMALRERDVRAAPEARAEGDAGGPAGGVAGSARAAVHRAAHRVLRHLAHDGRGGGGVVRHLRQARDADVRVSPLQRHARAGRRRLRGDARGAVAPLRAHRVGRISGARPAGDRRRQGAGRRRGERAGGAGPAPGSADRHREGAGAQGRARRTSCFPDRDEVLNLPSDHPGLHLLQQIRDEAHRFAIQGHRARRAKARTTSTLQEIAGIGATRRKALLQHFGGVKGVQAASVEDIARVPGISRALAERIFAEHLH